VKTVILAAHQPNYLPWCGYFFKMAHCDVLVILDDVQFTKNNYQNRTRIKGPKGSLWLTQPVLQSGRTWQPTHAVEFDQRVDWRTKHLKTLLANYAKSTNASAMLALCDEWLGGTSRLLAETNTRIIRGVAQLLALRAEIVLSSTLGLQLTKTDRLAAICRSLGATVYLSGQGGRSYQQEEQFREYGIELAYSDFTPHEYPQLWGEFCPGLSIVDALFNLGARATASLLEKRAD
jgi:hypothetical protein